MKIKFILSLEIIFIILITVFCFIKSTENKKEIILISRKLEQILNIEIAIDTKKDVNSIQEIYKEKSYNKIEKKEQIIEQEKTIDNNQNKGQEEISQEEIISSITFGEQYARLIIDKIGVNALIFYGANDNIILYGVGHEEESYFPNQNGSIILCGHNYMNNFNRFDELALGDIIKIETQYGTFSYQLYDAKVVFETEREKAPIQNEEEILMIYTCYPLKDNKFTQYRYLLSAKKCN